MKLYPPPQKLVFPRPKKWIGFLYNTLLKIQTAIFDLIFCNISGQNGVICFPAKILSRRSRLSRTLRSPFRLIRPRPIGCNRNRGSEQPVKIFLVSGQFLFLNNSAVVPKAARSIQDQHQPKNPLVSTLGSHGAVLKLGGSVLPMDNPALSRLLHSA